MKKIKDIREKIRQEAIDAQKPNTDSIIISEVAYTDGYNAGYQNGLIKAMDIIDSTKRPLYK